jgi:hypothetical protein
MPFTIRVKRGSSNPTTQLLEGELGYNTATDKLFVGNGVGISATGISMDGHTHPFTAITGTATTGQIPSLDASKITTGTFTDTQIPNLNTSKLTSGTLPIGRGGTGNTSVNQGGVVFGQTGGGGYTSTSTPSTLNQYLGVTGGANNQPLWRTPGDSSTYGVLSDNLTTLATERDIYWGTHYNFIGITTSAIANSTTYTTMAFTSGMRNFILHIHQDTTTGSVIAQIPLVITGGTHYSLDTSARTHRVAWSNGSTTQVMNVDLFYTGTTLSFRHNFTGASLGFRWFGY